MRSATREINRVRPSRRELIVARLLGAVERLLDAGDTYASISVGRLADEAGISRSSFYGYFADKAELLEELAADVVVHLTEVGTVLWDLPGDADRDAVRDAVAGIVETYRRHATLLAAVIDAGATEPTIRERYYATVQQSADNVAEHMRRGQAEGWITAELDPEGTAPWLVWMVERSLHQLLHRAPAPDAQELTENLTAIVWRTLYAGLR